MIVNLIIALLIILFVGLPVFNILSAGLFDRSNTNAVVLIGHRGAAGLAPENTLPAFDAGLAYGMDFIETDIRQTSDGYIVAIHDRTIDRTTTGKGAVHQMTYAELQQADASRSFPGYDHVTHIPLLQEVLERIKDTRSGLLIEIKDHKLYQGIVPKLAEIIKKTGTENKVIVFSFEEAPVIEIKKLVPGIKTGILGVFFKTPRSSLSVEYICPNWAAILYFPFLIRRNHRKGFKILAWTVNRSYLMRYLLNKQIDGIISDRPDMLAAIRKQRY